MTDENVLNAIPESSAQPQELEPSLDSAIAIPAPAGQPPPFRIGVTVHSDVGCVRTNNEDAFGFDENLGIFVVCDGMGGGPNGELASATAVDTLLKSYASTANSGDSIGSRLLRAIVDANDAVWAAAQSPENQGMGTTTVAAALDGTRLIVGNVGDSRAYLLKKGFCTQLTVDHSYVNELIRTGALTRENAPFADLQGMESMICRAVGAAPLVEPDIFSTELENGAAVLLASDGLTRYLLQDEIVAVIGSSSFDTACENLVAVAKQRGGVDNITCMLLLAIARSGS